MSKMSSRYFFTLLCQLTVVLLYLPSVELACNFPPYVRGDWWFRNKNEDKQYTRFEGSAQTHLFEVAGPAARSMKGPGAMRDEGAYNTVGYNYGPIAPPAMGPSSNNTRKKRQYNDFLYEQFFYDCMAEKKQDPLNMYYYIRHEVGSPGVKQCVKLVRKANSPLMVYYKSNDHLFACSFSSRNEVFCQTQAPLYSGGARWKRSTNLNTQNEDLEGAMDNGHYTYVAQDGQQTRKRKASFFSPRLHYVGSACLQFCYIITHKQIKLHVKTNSFDGNNYELINDNWSSSGVRHKWKRKSVDLQLNAEHEVVEFLAEFEPNVHGFAAVDELLITVGACSDYIFDCNFGETSAWYCNLIQDDSDLFNWKVDFGETPVSDTGPLTGYGGGGYYMYLDVTEKQTHGAYARISTPKLNMIGSVCVSFQYHMYGRFMGNLRIYKQKNHESAREYVWLASKDQGDMWHTGQVDVELDDANNMIGIEGMVGLGVRNHMAVDNFFITQGLCTKFRPTVEQIEQCARASYPDRRDVIIKYPFDFSAGRCPIPAGQYQATVKTNFLNPAACENNSNSVVTVTETTIVINTCLTNNTNDAPLHASPFRCVDELSIDLMVMEEDEGHIFILSRNSTRDPYGREIFYTMRYIIATGSSVQFSLQGTWYGDLRPDPNKPYNSAGKTNLNWDYDFAFSLTKK